MEYENEKGGSEVLERGTRENKAVWTEGEGRGGKKKKRKEGEKVKMLCH